MLSTLHSLKKDLGLYCVFSLSTTLAGCWGPEVKRAQASGAPCGGSSSGHLNHHSRCSALGCQGRVLQVLGGRTPKISPWERRGQGGCEQSNNRERLGKTHNLSGIIWYLGGDPGRFKYHFVATILKEEVEMTFGVSRHCVGEEGHYSQSHRMTFVLAGLHILFAARKPTWREVCKKKRPRKCRFKDKKMWNSKQEPGSRSC